jgi:hypothetical protein
LLSHAAAVLPVLLVIGGCGNSGSEEGDDFGNLLASPAGLIVVREEHPTGWGRPDCLACHEVRNMHIVNRTGLPNCDDVPDPSSGDCIDLPEIQSIIHNQGEDSCSLCHGDNGVTP